MDVRYGDGADAAWLAAEDAHVGTEWIGRCLGQREYLLAADAGDRLGFLRFSLFWGRIPYMDVVRVIAGRRGQGIGRALVGFWEAEMAARGARVLMTSCQLDEPEPRAWHIGNGYRESGRLTFGRYQETEEQFLVKDLP